MVAMEGHPSHAIGTGSSTQLWNRVEISAAWGIKELLRQMLQAHGLTGNSRHQTSTRRTRVPGGLRGRGHARRDPASPKLRAV